MSTGVFVAAIQGSPPSREPAGAVLAHRVSRGTRSQARSPRPQADSGQLLPYRQAFRRLRPAVHSPSRRDSGSHTTSGLCGSALGSAQTSPPRPGDPAGGGRGARGTDLQGDGASTPRRLPPCFPPSRVRGLPGTQPHAVARVTPGPRDVRAPWERLALLPLLESVKRKPENEEDVCARG